MTNNALFLDFDGVLFDTLREAYAVAMISTGKVNQLKDIDYEATHYHLFKKMRPFVSPAWNYKYLLECLETEQHDFSTLKQKYSEQISQAELPEYEAFEDTFFKTRHTLKTHYYEQWLRLNVPFPFLSKIEYYLTTFQESIFIVTTKDKATVLKLLDIENIIFDEKRIYDKIDYAQYGNKKNIIERVMLDKIEQAVFIDDSDKHIRDCSNIHNVICLQPEWGYVNPDSITSGQSVIINKIHQLLQKDGTCMA